MPTKVKHSNSIPVVFASDENYLMPTYVAIYSLFINSNEDTKYDVHILVPESVEGHHKEDINSLIEHFPKQTINFVDMGSAFSDVKMSIKHITRPTYYRLHIPDILHDYGKCIYLDSDLIVNSDLRDLFETDLEGYYVAGVKAAGYHLEKNGNERLKSILKIPSIGTYVNAGVSLLNLDEMRKDNLSKKMLDLVDEGYPSQDQDIINKACFGKIKVLPVKYNVMTKYSIFGGKGRSDAREFEVYPMEEVKEAKKSPIIIHYADKIKPWQSKNIIFGAKWWSIVEKLPEDFKQRNIYTLPVTDDFMEKTISIFGSTCSSHIIPRDRTKVINEFVARSSVMSVNEDPAENKVSDDFMANFDRWSAKMVLHDIKKTAVHSLLSVISDYVMIDNHECRFNLIDVELYGEKIRLTDSHLMRKAITSDSNIKVLKEVKLKDLTDKECEKAVKDFANQILEVFDIEQVIVNEVIETELYLNKQGKVDVLSNLSEIKSHNLNAERIYKLYKKYFAGAHFVSMPRGIISKTHNSASDNFNHDYYEQKREAVFEIMKGSNRLFDEDSEWYIINSEKNENILENLKTQEIDESKAHISFIVPTYNNEDTIEECLISILNQSIKSIEIICINDCSTDRTSLILQRLKKMDKRLKIINHKKNQGTSVSRKEGVELAKSDYIMFADADDYLEQNACEKMLRTIISRNVDIVCCGANVINVDQPEYRVNWMTNFVKPRLGYMYASQIFKETFIDRKSNHLLWNKIIKTSVCKEAYAHVSNSNYPKGNDRYAYFFITLKVKSYYGIEDKFYNYRLGTGISNKEDMSMDRFDGYLAEYDICDEEEKYLIENKYDKIYFTAIDNIRKEITDNLCNTWYEHVSEDHRSKSFNKMVYKVGMTEIAGSLAKISGKNVTSNIAKRFLEAFTRKDKVKTINTIGIFYHRLSNGGVERVISKLIPGYIERGYSVVLILEERNEQEEFPIPDEVDVRVINPSKNISKEEYLEHAKDLRKVLEECNIDVLLYQASSSPFLLYDSMITKDTGRFFVISIHVTFGQQMVLGHTDFIDQVDVFGVADYIHTLNRMEEQLWRSFGHNSKYIRNPLTFDLNDAKISEIDNDNILWVGRFDDYQKCFTEAIDTFEIIHASQPNARMFMVGRGENKEVDRRVEEYIHSKNLSDCILLPGYVNDMSDYYANSSLLLCTSAYETYPMVLGEAMSHGLPIAMFDLPYLEIIEENKGHTSVEQKNTVRLAFAVLKMMKDRNLLRQMGSHNRKSIEEIDKQPLFDEWDKLFSELINNEWKPEGDNLSAMFVRTTLFHYVLGTSGKKSVPHKTGGNLRVIKNMEYSTSDTISASIRYLRQNGIKSSIIALYNQIKNGLFSK